MNPLLLSLAVLSASPAEQHFLDAITRQDLADVRSQLKKDPSVINARTPRGSSVLLVAANNLADGESFYPPQKNEVLQELLLHRKPATLFEACMVGDTARAKALLEKDPDAARTYDASGWTLLHAAAFAGDLETVKLLVAKGASVNAVAKTHFTNTPLQTAMLTGQAAVARYLVEAGADVNHPQVEGFTVIADASLGATDTATLPLSWRSSHETGGSPAPVDRRARARGLARPGALVQVQGLPWHGRQGNDEDRR